MIVSFRFMCWSCKVGHAAPDPNELRTREEEYDDGALRLVVPEIHLIRQMILKCNWCGTSSMLKLERRNPNGN